MAFLGELPDWPPWQLAVTQCAGELLWNERLRPICLEWLSV